MFKVSSTKKDEELHPDERSIGKATSVRCKNGDLSLCPLTRIGLKKSRLDRKWLCALFSQSLEDLHIISRVMRDTLWSAMWTNSSSGVVLQRSRRWKPKPFVRTWTEEIKHSSSGVGKCKRGKEQSVQTASNHSEWFKEQIHSVFTSTH